MNILIEGEDYPITWLEDTFENTNFYQQEGEFGRIHSVGYYHSYLKGTLVYMLPKVFMKNEKETVFGISKYELYQAQNHPIYKHKKEFDWIRQISIYFYYGLQEFKKRNSHSILIQNTQLAQLNTNLKHQEYSYLDVLLSFINFHKKNKIHVLFKKTQSKSKRLKKAKWSKTVKTTIPILTENNQPIYHTYQHKKKVINFEEELIIYFFSILNHFSISHQLHLNIDKSYPIIKGAKFTRLQQNGLTILKKIKYRYFSDVLKKMYALCEIYFSQTDTSSLKKRKEDFLIVNNYNIVFEDMVDKLFSDKIESLKTKESVSLKKLKYNKDGKIIDHIYEYQSLLDTSNIYYIGDSKYYKTGNLAGITSKYKQFTYAKNVIQYNIDLQNSNENYTENKLKYRDTNVTEGYNITPNFFIYGYIKDYKNFDDTFLESYGKTVKSYHYKDRLFDRDSLFVQQYKLNFLYILKAYTYFKEQKTQKFRLEIRSKFRRNFIDFFNNKSASSFTFFIYQGKDIKKFVTSNFKLLNGKCYQTSEDELIIAKHKNDNSILRLLVNCLPLKLT